MFTPSIHAFARLVLLVAPLVLLPACAKHGGQAAGTGEPSYRQPDPTYQDKETRELVALVNDAAALVRAKGDAAFGDLRVPGSRWRQGETYIFVLDPQGDMLVHPDAALEGKNQLGLKDVAGKPIIRGILDATALPGKPAGWYHYEWPAPEGVLPRWKSTYAQRVTGPSGKAYVVGSGMYNDRMERAFVVDTVKDAAGEIEKHGTAALPRFRDPTGPFIAKDGYVFVYDMNGVSLVLPPFPSLEGQNFLNTRDTQGKHVMREMLEVVQSRGSGWVDYMWPKPGESVSTRKSAYVTKVKMGDRWVVVGSGVYLDNAPKAAPAARTMTAPELMKLVREAAEIFEKRGEQAYPEFRREGSKWLQGDRYFFVWTMDGIRAFHGANPAWEGKDVRDLKDVRGKPFGRMFLEVARSASGEGWVHYVYPEPGNMFPAWKSTFVKRVTFPSGEERLIGCGIYNMKLDKTFIEDIVDRAAALIAEQGKGAFGQLRDKNGPFYVMDTYVFVNGSDGTNLVDAGHPSLEGKSMIDQKDPKGKYLVRDYIDAAMKNGSAWVEYDWYKPGRSTPAHKQTFVRKVQSGADTYIVGSGLYVDD